MVEVFKNYSILDDSKEKYYDSNDSVFLKTCKRNELYIGKGPVSEDLLFHLFKVVSGLDSPLIGENAIQGQVKQAYHNAKEKSSLNKTLHLLFQHALFVGKKVRTETQISKGALSYESGAVNLLLSKGIDLSSSRITILGVHNMNRHIVNYLIRRNAKTIIVSNRTYEKALLLARETKTSAVKFDQLETVLKNTDILISATSAPHFIVTKKKFPVAKKMTVIDLAYPHDICPSIAHSEYVDLFNLTDIEEYVSKNLYKRKREVNKALEIINKEVKNFIVRQGKDFD